MKTTKIRRCGDGMNKTQKIGNLTRKRRRRREEGCG
jgi:hypothetical protein